MMDTRLTNFSRPGPLYWLRDFAQLSISLVEFRARTATYPNVQQELSDLAQRLYALSQPILVSIDETTGLVPVIPMLQDRWRALQPERPDITGIIGGTGLWLAAQPAIALNLAADEILRNSLRHAFPERTGHITVTVDHKEDSGEATVRITDDGVGALSATLATSTNGLGLVRELAVQLAADISIVSAPKSGTAVTFRFSTLRGARQPA
jgi:two-component sensor histidine kinase